MWCSGGEIGVALATEDTKVLICWRGAKQSLMWGEVAGDADRFKGWDAAVARLCGIARGGNRMQQLSLLVLVGAEMGGANQRIEEVEILRAQPLKPGR